MGFQPPMPDNKGLCNKDVQRRPTFDGKECSIGLTWGPNKSTRLVKSPPSFGIRALWDTQCKDFTLLAYGEVNSRAGARLLDVGSWALLPVQKLRNGSMIRSLRRTW